MELLNLTDAELRAAHASAVVKCDGLLVRGATKAEWQAAYYGECQRIEREIKRRAEARHGMAANGPAAP